MKQMNFSKIKQDLNTLLGTYRGKRHDNYLKAQYPLFRNSLDTVQWATWFPHAFPFFGIPSAVCLIGYKLLGHTNKARVQPIKSLLTIVNYIEFTLANFTPAQDLYRQRLAAANRDLLKRMQEIRAYPSESSEYIKLNEICDKLHGYLLANQFKKDNQEIKVADSGSEDILFGYLGQ